MKTERSEEARLLALRTEAGAPGERIQVAS